MCGPGMTTARSVVERNSSGPEERSAGVASPEDRVLRAAVPWPDTVATIVAGYKRPS